MKRFAAIACVAACSFRHAPPPEQKADGSGSAAPAAASEISEGSAIDVAGMNRAVAPGDDFFRFVNGTWLDKTAIPEDRSSFGTFAELAERTDARIAALVQDAAKTAAPGTEARRVGDYYTAFMDETGIEAKGMTPLEPELAAIAAIKTKQQLATALGKTLRADVDVLNATNVDTPNLFGLWVAQDLDDPTKYSAFLLQGGLGLPDRDYYVSTSPKLNEIRQKYTQHLSKIFSLAKSPNPDEQAFQTLQLEQAIATAHATRTETEDVHKGDNHWARGDFQKRAPGLDWQAFFAAAGLGKVDQLVVWQPNAVQHISELVASQPLEMWKAWLAAHAIDRASPDLSKDFADEAFAFYGQTLQGTPKQRERWKRAVSATSAAMSEAVGKLYVAKYFPPREKARAEAMVKRLIAAMGARIDHLEWMAPATKEKAKAKLATLKVGVGYPDTWRDYSALEVKPDDAFGNAERAEQLELQRALAKLGTPVNRDEWAMPPQLVNAVNQPAMNALNFPAAILQPPYFDPDRPAAMDYGAAGAIIGHEISHSFDDQGAMFDATGKLANWWTPDDLKHFQDAGAQLAAEFDTYSPLPDVHVSGKQTLSENIADVAGLAVAFDAYHASLGGKAAPVVQGFTGDQQFFIAFGESWRSKAREPALRRQLVTDGHAPAEYRADTVRNLDPWYTAFGVTGGKLYLSPADRVRIW